LKKFEFRLARLERVREIEKDRAAVELADRERSRKVAQSRRDEDRDELERVEDEMRLTTDESVNVETLLELDYYSQIARRVFHASSEALGQAVVAEDGARVSLIEKAQSAKAVSLFRERKFEEYSKENSRLEQKDIDETAGNLYIRSRFDATS